tara:strand:- start:99 stop:965 length:867 start_codon:yes stop_codon:yes gene_type:complete
MSIILDGTSGITTPNTDTPNNFAFKNLLINAGFTINQRAYVSAATLATTVYAHDRWKAGAGGGNYSFTQNASSTTITIAAGKSLIQVVEDKNVNGTSFVLRWTGTAQARYAVNSATPAGAYAASPIVITGQTAGTTMSVEFNAGTLTTPQLESGAVATSFDQRAYSQELVMCQRYYYRVFPALNDCSLASSSWVSSATTGSGIITFPVTMRIRPTVLEQSGTAGNYSIQSDTGGSTQCSSVPIWGSSSPFIATVNCTVASGLTVGRGCTLRSDATTGASAFFGWSAEL